ncbi:MAG: hypothetical protein AAGI88_15560 [Pseudomonadota bacterium]
MITTNRLNECTYCVAAHTGAAKAHKVDKHVIDALRSSDAINDPKLEALRQFAVTVNAPRGWPKEEQVTDLIASRPTSQCWRLSLESA